MCMRVSRVCVCLKCQSYALVVITAYSAEKRPLSTALIFDIPVNSAMQHFPPPRIHESQCAKSVAWWVDKLHVSTLSTKSTSSLCSNIWISNKWSWRMWGRWCQTTLTQHYTEKKLNKTFTFSVMRHFSKLSSDFNNTQKWIVPLLFWLNCTSSEH